METQVQPLSCRLRPGLPASLLTARRPAAVQSNPSTKESCSPPEYGAVGPKNLSRVFHPSEFASAPGSDIKYCWKLALSGCQSSSMFSGLVQALHQFRILTGASSSPVSAKSRDGGCRRKSWVVPSITRAGGLAHQRRINELCRRRGGQKFGWMACARCLSKDLCLSASHHLIASLALE